LIITCPPHAGVSEFARQRSSIETRCRLRACINFRHFVETALRKPAIQSCLARFSGSGNKVKPCVS
jgi:hypothetical protein